MELIDRTKFEPHQIYDEDGWVEVVYVDDIREMPTVEAEPVKHGRWVPVTNGRGGFECSVCTNYAPSYRDGVEWRSRFCPTCGARMDGGEDE